MSDIQHEIFTNEDGQRMRRYKSGVPIKGNENYMFGRHGEVRHATAQFKGSKKQRRKFREVLKASFGVPLPHGMVPLEPEEKLSERDLVMDAPQQRWVKPPRLGLTIDELAVATLIYTRACTPTSLVLPREPGKILVP